MFIIVRVVCSSETYEVMTKYNLTHERVSAGISG